MRKHLLATTLLLAFGMPMAGTFAAYAAPEPQSQGQATVSITGTVFDENNEPVIGASVVQKGMTSNAAVTDFEGNFTLRVKPGDVLRISFVGYQTVEIGAQQGMMVYLQPTTEMLNELVAIGYGSQKKANLTGAVSTVDVARVMEGRPYQDVTQALQGAVPGLTIDFASGELDASSTVRIRGIGTLSAAGNGSPLYVVDGVEMSDISYLNPQDIESISVLKDAASSAIYGTRAAFGVILVQTKGASKSEKVSVRYTNNFGWSQATYLPSFPSVPDQLRAGIAGIYRLNGGRAESFNMAFEDLLPYAEAWEAQHNGPYKSSVEMHAFQDWNNVGDYMGVDGSAIYYANWDVASIWFNNAAFSQSHNVTISGTSGNTNYYLTFGYDGKEGLIKINPDHRTKYNVSANINTKLTKFLEAGVRFNWNRTAMYRPNTYWSNQLQTIWRWGSWFGPWGRIDGEPFRLMADRMEARTRSNISDLLRMTAYLKANITQNITLNADFTYWTNNVNEKGGDGYVYGIDSWSRNVNPSYIITQASSYTDRSNGKYNTWNFNVYANFDKTWNEKHNLGVMLGVNAQNESYEWFKARRGNLLDLNHPMLNLADGDLTLLNNNFNGAYSKAYAGYFGRITYNFRDTYLVEFNGRYDGSSSFPGGRKWAFFPSVSAGYRISQENFWEPIRTAWSNAKIRASYGEVGNENISNYSYYSTIASLATGSSYWVTGQDGNKVNMFDMPTLVDNSLTWERIRTTDVGVDLGFMNNSLNITFDWYQRENANMLAPAKTYPSVLGASSPVQNAGSLRTRGWELSIGWNHAFGDWMVYANASVSDAISTITKWDNDTKLLNSNYSGKRYGDIWGFETDRYFTEADFNGKNADGSWNYKPGIADQTGLQQGTFVYGPGDIKFKDLNGDGKIDGGAGTAEDHGDLKVIGNSLPRYEYSFRLGAGFKGFDLDLFFTGVGKMDTWTISPFNFPLMREADLTLFANQTSYNVYDPENGIVNISEANDYPTLYAGSNGGGTVNGILEGNHNYYPQSKYLVNRAFLRLKNLTFGYTIPASITQKAYIQNARIYFSCNNPFMLYKGNNLPVDPEVSQAQGYSINTAISGNASLYWGRAIPTNRTFSFGVQVTF